MSRKHKAVKEILDDLKLEAVFEPGKHFRIRLNGPLGSQFVVCPGTPSDHRALLNLRAQIKRTAAQVGLLEGKTT